MSSTKGPFNHQGSGEKGKIDQELNDREDIEPKIKDEKWDQDKRISGDNALPKIQNKSISILDVYTKKIIEEKVRLNFQEKFREVVQKLKQIDGLFRTPSLEGYKIIDNQKYSDSEKWKKLNDLLDRNRKKLNNIKHKEGKNLSTEYLHLKAILRNTMEFKKNSYTVSKQGQNIPEKPAGSLAIEIGTKSNVILDEQFKILLSKLLPSKNAHISAKEIVSNENLSNLEKIVKLQPLIETHKDFFKNITIKKKQRNKTITLSLYDDLKDSLQRLTDIAYQLEQHTGLYFAAKSKSHKMVPHGLISAELLQDQEKGLLLKEAEVKQINDYIRYCQHNNIPIKPLMPGSTYQYLNSNNERISFKPSLMVVMTNDIPPKKYAMSALLGKGGYGEVKLAQDIESGHWVAGKITKIKVANERQKRQPQKQREPQRQSIIEAQQEVLAHKQIQKQKMIKAQQELVTQEQMNLKNFGLLRGIAVMDGDIARKTHKEGMDADDINEEETVISSHFTFQDMIPGQELSHYVNSKKHEDPNEKALEKINILIAMMEDLQIRFHSKNIIHRDIKPNNMIYDPITGKVRLIDMGLSVDMNTAIITKNKEHSGVNDSRTKFFDKYHIRTHNYASPEVEFDALYSKQTDIFAMGVSMQNTVLKDADKTLQETEAYDQLVQLSNDMSHASPSERPSGEEVLKRLHSIREEFNTKLTRPRLH